ncbi:MAG: glycosyltransferase [Bacteroidaceae bacterium]|nr:glycosyltransferase [Bacteroidaceae bacterium]
MNICILTPRFPYPQFGGDALRINEIARYLKQQGHHLILVSLSDDANPPVAQAKELYDKVYFVKRNKVMSLLIGAINFLLGKPIQCGYYSSNAYRRLFREVIQKEKPDLYVSHLLRMVPYLNELHLEQKSIIEMTDALSKTYILSSKAQGVGLLKYVYKLEQKLIARYEKYVTTHYPKVVLVSQADIDYLKQNIQGDTASLALHSNGVGYIENISTAYDVDKICFMGNMRSMQNQDAALYFANDIFPLIKAKRPTAKFYIVGSLPPGNIQTLASDDIIITGFVDDLGAFLQDACLLVAPIRVAAGIQNKVLVGMCCGIPVVLTSLISHAIPELTDGENCLIRDGEQPFADACLRLMEDPAQRSSIAQKGYDMVRQHYSWEEKLRGYEIMS